MGTNKDYLTCVPPLFPLQNNWNPPLLMFIFCSANLIPSTILSTKLSHHKRWKWGGQALGGNSGSRSYWGYHRGLVEVDISAIVNSVGGAMIIRFSAGTIIIRSPYGLLRSRNSRPPVFRFGAGRIGGRPWRRRQREARHGFGVLCKLN